MLKKLNIKLKTSKSLKVMKTSKSRKKKVKKDTSSSGKVTNLELVRLKSEVCDLQKDIETMREDFKIIDGGLDIIRQISSRMGECNPNMHPIKFNVFDFWKINILHGLSIATPIVIKQIGVKDGDNAS